MPIGIAMSALEETIDATLDASGHLQLAHQPQLPPGPVQVTIRPAPTSGARHGLADVVQQIADDQRRRGFPGRSAANVNAEEASRLDEDAERDRELEAARRAAS